MSRAKSDSALQSFRDQYGTRKATLPGAGLPWLATRREEGMARFLDLGLPTTRLEAWKYTRLRSLEDTRFRAADAADGRISLDVVPSVNPGGASGRRLVFVNGHFRADLSEMGTPIEGLEFCPLEEAAAGDGEWLEAHLARAGEQGTQAFLALNTALMDSGFVLRVHRGVVVEEPIEIVFVGGLTDSPVSYFPRNLIVLEEGSRATVVKSYAGLGGGAYFANAATEVLVGDGAVLRHYKVQAETRDATHLATTHVRVGRDAVYEGFGLTMGGRLSRNEMDVRLEGEGGECRLSGAFLMRGSEHCDNTTTIEHVVPHTACREVFKGVLDDQSRAVFQGRIVVHRNAQGTDGQQLCKALLLSRGAEMDAKPELEIYADDVKCSHGATTGQIDEAALFYLRSRGVPEALARNLLIRSFLEEAFEQISSTDVRAAFMDRVVHWLPAACYLQEEWRDG